MVHDSASAAPIQAGVARVFDEASGYYRQLRWERNRLVRFEKWLTQTTIEEELTDARVSSALELGCGPGNGAAGARSLTGYENSESWRRAPTRSSKSGPSRKRRTASAIGFSCCPT